MFAEAIPSALGAGAAGAFGSYLVVSAVVHLV
jgi:hypothetical protein